MVQIKKIIIKNINHSLQKYIYPYYFKIYYNLHSILVIPVSYHSKNELVLRLFSILLRMQNFRERDCNGTRTHKQLVPKRTLNHFRQL